MLQTTAISRSLERALPGNLREAPEVTSVLSQKIHSAGIFNFDDSAKTSGIFAVAKGEAEWIGGQLAESFRYVLTRGDKILSSGELVGTKKISGSYEVRINTSSTEIKERDLEKGTPPFVIELVLDEPKKSRITLRADREVIVDGEVNVRLLSRGQVEIGQSSFASTTQVVPTGRVVSLTEHALDRSGIRLRADDSPEMTRFPNTLVGLWMHIPSMDETLKVQLDTAISRRKSATTLNVLIEQVTQDDSIRGALGIYYNHQLKAPKEAPLTLSTGVLDLDPEEQADSHNASIIKVIREVAEKHGLEPQVHYVDFNLSASISETHRKWTQKVSEWQKCAVQDGSKLQALKPTPREAILTLARQYSEASSASFNEREALVAKQMRRFALAPTDGAVNVLLVGAAHQKVLEALPGAKPFYVRIPIEFKTVLPARVYDSLSRIRDPFEHMRDITDRGGKIPEPLARQGFLFTRLNSLMEYVMPEILRPSRECKIIWDGGLHQVAATIMSSCITPAESRVLFLAALNPKNDRKQPEILIDWIAKKFDLDLRPHKTDLNTFVRTIGTKAAPQIK